MKQKHYPRIIVILLVVFILAFICLYNIKNPFKTKKYSINFIIGEKLSSTSLNDDFIKMLDMAEDSTGKITYVPNSFSVTGFYKENKTTSKFSREYQTIDKVPTKIVFTSKLDKKFNESIKNISLNKIFLNDSKLSLSAFSSQVNSVIDRKTIVLVFVSDSSNSICPLTFNSSATFVFNKIEKLISKKDSILFKQPSAKLVIVYGLPQCIQTQCGDLISSISNLAMNNNTQEGRNIVADLLKNCFDSESAIYPVDSLDRTRFEPLSAEDFLMDIYLTNDLVNLKFFKPISNPQNGKIKTLEYYKERARDVIR